MALSVNTHALVVCFPQDPVELAELELVSTPDLPLGVGLCALTPNALVLHQPPVSVPLGRPLELAVSLSDCGLIGPASSSAMERCLETHVRVSVFPEGLAGSDATGAAVPVSARTCGAGWTLRVLASPKSWAYAPAFTLGTQLLAGRPLLSTWLPAAVEVVCSHVRARKGAVWDAARRGDVPALMQALASGGSTEEADEVRGDASVCLQAYVPTAVCPLQFGRTALWVAANAGREEAARVLVRVGADAAAKDRVRT